jgi:ubiquinol-cytochrome c reductase core subunit 2
MSFLRLRQAASVARRSYATVSEASGVKVAGIDSGVLPAATTSITVVVKAGARYETQPGIAHVLKNFAFKVSCNIEQAESVHGFRFGLKNSPRNRAVRRCFICGPRSRAPLPHCRIPAWRRVSPVHCGTDCRDHFLNVLASVLSSTHYYPHEYSELVLPTIQSESLSALASSSTLAMDAAHSIAFRRGLGNSLYASPHSPVSAVEVKNFAQQAFAKSNIAVLGAGISTENLSKAVQSAFGSGSGGESLSSGSSQYYGGEQRIPLDVHAGPGAQPTMVIAYGTTNTSADLKVLPHLLGGETAVKWSHGTSPLSQVAAKVHGASAKAFLLPYSDASLFGVVVTAPTSEGVASVAKEVAGLMKGLKGKDEEIKRAVSKAKFYAATQLERHESLIATAGAAVSTRPWLS